MPLVSVLSITHPADSGYILDALDSVAAQRLPPGWELEWVVQEDGPTSDLGERLAAKYDWVRYDANGARLGIGSTRNFALARVRGQLVQNLDSDDLLLPGALDLITRFDDPAIHWAIGQADDRLYFAAVRPSPGSTGADHVSPTCGSWWEQSGRRCSHVWENVGATWEHGAASADLRFIRYGCACPIILIFEGCE